MRSSLVIFTGVAFLLAACGTTQSDRAISGAGIGAGAGAVVGAVTGLTVLQGVLLGAAAGGLTGALTNSDIINLGDPIWERQGQAPNSSATARVQAGLQELGYNPGPIDGQKGAQTTEAIRAYQRDNGLLVDGRASIELASHIDQKIGS